MKQWTMAVVLAGLVLMAAGAAFATTTASKDVASTLIQEENVKCINCHLKENNALVQQWKNSPHAAAQDGQVGCFNCHAADPGDPVGYLHEGAFIKTVQSPVDCGFCHEQAVKDMAVSHHATAAQLTASLDNVLGEVVCSMENKAGAANGCWQCHGTEVKVLLGSNGKPLLNQDQAVMFDPLTYPNAGVGRINPDGTLLWKAGRERGSGNAGTLSLLRGLFNDRSNFPGSCIEVFRNKNKEGRKRKSSLE